jgi:hypothetical protein
MLKKYTIYGERCSGTNYLQNIMNINFDIKLTHEYGKKHFFGFQDEKLKKSDDTLFICIVRNPVDWVNSLYREKYHIAKHLRKNITDFLNKEFYSYNDKHSGLRDRTEIMEDRNIYTGKRYKNIFELRHTKIKWMMEELPNKVKNYIFIKHEDLLNNYKNTLLKINEKGVKIKDNIKFPINSKTYKLSKTKIYVKKKNEISSETILDNPNFIPFYEKKLYNVK